jgi:hypothetical protein
MARNTNDFNAGTGSPVGPEHPADTRAAAESARNNATTREQWLEAQRTLKGIEQNVEHGRAKAKEAELTSRMEKGRAQGATLGDKVDAQSAGEDLSVMRAKAHIAANSGVDDPVARAESSKALEARSMAEIGGELPAGRRALFQQQIGEVPKSDPKEIAKFRDPIEVKAQDRVPLGTPNVLAADAPKTEVKAERAAADANAAERTSAGSRAGILDLNKVAKPDTMTDREYKSSMKSKERRLGRKDRFAIVTDASKNHADPDVRAAASAALKSGTIDHPGLIDHVRTTMGTHVDDRGVDIPAPSSLSLKGRRLYSQLELNTQRRVNNKLRKQERGQQAAETTKANRRTRRDIMNNPDEDGSGVTPQLEASDITPKMIKERQEDDARVHSTTAAGALDQYKTSINMPKAPAKVSAAEVSFGRDKELTALSGHMGMHPTEIHNFVREEYPHLTPNEAITALFRTRTSGAKDARTGEDVFSGIVKKGQAHAKASKAKRSETAAATQAKAAENKAHTENVSNYLATDYESTPPTPLTADAPDFVEPKFKVENPFKNAPTHPAQKNRSKTPVALDPQKSTAGKSTGGEAVTPGYISGLIHDKGPGKPKTRDRSDRPSKFELAEGPKPTVAVPGARKPRRGSKKNES